MCCGKTLSGLLVFLFIRTSLRTAHAEGDESWQGHSRCKANYNCGEAEWRAAREHLTKEDGRRDESGRLLLVKGVERSTNHQARDRAG